MRESIKGYRSQQVIKGLKSYSLRIWGVVSVAVSAWVIMLLLAPATAAGGHTGISGPIYGFYSYLCHQIPERSFFLFGHQFAVCARCFGVYFGLLAGLLAYPLFRPMDNSTPFPRVWLFVSMVPMAVDWTLGYSGIWENTHLSRVITGLILGVACAVFIVPALVEIAELSLMKKQDRNTLSSSAAH